MVDVFQKELPQLYFGMATDIATDITIQNSEAYCSHIYFWWNLFMKMECDCKILAHINHIYLRTS